MPSIIDKKSVEGFGIAFVEAAQFGIPSIGGIYLILRKGFRLAKQFENAED